MVKQIGNISSQSEFIRLCSVHGFMYANIGLVMRIIVKLYRDWIGVVVMVVVTTGVCIICFYPIKSQIWNEVYNFDLGMAGRFNSAKVKMLYNLSRIKPQIHYILMDFLFIRIGVNEI